MTKQKNSIATKRIQVSVDENTHRILEDIVPLGIHGRSLSQIIDSIVRAWIWENRDALKEEGVLVRPHKRRGRKE